MSFNGSGTFVIDSTGQPVQSGTTISDSVFNALTADLATGLSTCLTKDGQTTPTANIPMGTYKLTGLGLGSATTDSARMDNATTQFVMEGRLGSDTPTSNGNITATDATTTIYLNVFRGNKIALYNGTQWVLRSIANAGGTNIAVPATTNTNYDVFAYDNSGTVTLELLAWASATARSAGIVYQDGVLCRSGLLTRRYLGTIRTGAVSGQVRDALTHRFIWNYYNQVPTRLLAVDGTASWNYTTATIRQANGSTANQVAFVIGVSEQSIRADVTGVATNLSSSTAFTGIGYDDTTAVASGYQGGMCGLAASSAVTQPMVGHVELVPAIGYHYLAWLEYSTASGTTTWYGTSAGNFIFPGISATIMM